MKICTQCNEEKDSNCYSTNGLKGLRSQCKVCRSNNAKQYRQAHTDQLSAKDKQYYLANKEHIQARNKQYAADHRDEICKNKCLYYEANIQSIKQYHAQHKLARNEQRKQRRKDDVAFRIAESLKSRIHAVLKDTMIDRTWKYIGCSKAELVKWLEYQFDSNTTWDNYGKVWHIDHVIPIDIFDMTRYDHQVVCFHWTNLRPLEKKQNLSKSNKLVVDDIIYHRSQLLSYIPSNQWYQAIPEKAWWSRKELEKGNNPEDDFAKWFAKEMGNPQLSS